MINTQKEHVTIHFRPDITAKGLSNELLAQLATGEGYEMGLEPVTIEELEHTYLYDGLVQDKLLLAAVTSITSRLPKTMAAFMRQLNKKLSGTDIKAGVKTEFYDDGGSSQEIAGVLISKPRSLGLFSVITAQIPCSDGQSVSIVFHAPDDDPKKITPDDKLIAFRFLLNKRDITHIVAPSNGKDISLDQTVMSLANALEKNSKRFQANLQKAMAARKELADKQDEFERLNDELAQVNAQIESIDSVNSSLKERENELKAKYGEKEKKANLLQVRIDEWKPAEPKEDPLEGSLSPEEKLALDTIRSTAESLGITITSTSLATGDYEHEIDVVSLVTLRKGKRHASIQIDPDGATAMFDHQANRAHGFGDHKFNGEYTDNVEELKARMKAFSDWADGIPAASDGGELNTKPLIVGDSFLVDKERYTIESIDTVNRSIVASGVGMNADDLDEIGVVVLGVNDAETKARLDDEAKKKANKAGNKLSEFESQINSVTKEQLAILAGFSELRNKGGVYSLYSNPGDGSHLSAEFNTVTKGIYHFEIGTPLDFPYAFEGDLKGAKDKLNRIAVLNLISQGYGDVFNDKYDPNDEYNPDNSIAGIKLYAPQYGIKVANVERNVEDFDGDYSVDRVTLKAGDETAYIQIAGDGKMSVYGSERKRVDRFGRYTFFISYSNDEDTLKDRLKAFGLWAGTYTEPKRDTYDTLIEELKDTAKNHLPELVALVKAYNDSGKTIDRPKAPQNFLSALNALSRRFDAIGGFQGLVASYKKIGEDLAIIRQARFADTMLNDLQNAGLAPLDALAPTGTPEPTELEKLIESTIPQVKALGAHMRLRYDEYGGISDIPQEIKSELSTILDKLQSNDVQAANDNAFVQALKSALAKNYLSDSYAELTDTWLAGEEPLPAVTDAEKTFMNLLDDTQEMVFEWVKEAKKARATSDSALVPNDVRNQVAAQVSVLMNAMSDASIAENEKVDSLLGAYNAGSFLVGLRQAGWETVRDIPEDRVSDQIKKLKAIIDGDFTVEPAIDTVNHANELFNEFDLYDKYSELAQANAAIANEFQARIEKYQGENK